MRRRAVSLLLGAGWIAALVIVVSSVADRDRYATDVAACRGGELSLKRPSEMSSPDLGWQELRIEARSEQPGGSVSLLTKVDPLPARGAASHSARRASRPLTARADGTGSAVAFHRVNLTPGAAAGYAISATATLSGLPCRQTFDLEAPEAGDASRRSSRNERQAKRREVR